VESLKLGKNDPCPCNSGKKYRQCCWLKRFEWTEERQPPPEPPAEAKQTVVHLPPSPTYWAAPPGQPNAAPPTNGEWTEWVFVKDKGWTHERDLKPGDQYRLKGGGWETVPPECVIGTTEEHPFYVQGKGWTPAGELKEGDLVRTMDGWVPITGIKRTGQVQTVYNLEIEDDHTYFVGKPEWGFSVWAHNAGFDYGGLKLEDVAKSHFPEGRARGRPNLDPAHPGEIVKVKAPGHDIEVATTSGIAEGKSYVTYAFVNKKTGAIEYVGRARTPSEVTDTSIQKAVTERLRRHKRLGTFDSDTQAVIVLDTQKTYSTHRGAEQFFNDLYEGRRAPLRGTYQPLDAVDPRTRQKSVDYLTSFFEEQLGYQNTKITTEVDARIAQRGGQ
jgi:hypothetical protein